MQHVRTLRTFLTVMLLAVSALGASGCYVEEAPPPAYYVEGGYEPQYYDGYIVYYDDYGRPYYYADGVAVWVPVTSPYYAVYVNHWRLYGPQYRVWYGTYGYRYRGYRPYVHYYGPHRGYYYYRRRR
jgi:hypothetical protein